jgi:hypothetical protein
MGMQQHRAEPPRLRDRIDGGTTARARRRAIVAVVRSDWSLEREGETGPARDALHPATRHVGSGDAIERAVDFHQREVRCDVRQRVEAALARGGVEDPIPVGIVPTGRTDHDFVVKRAGHGEATETK